MKANSTTLRCPYCAAMLTLTFDLIADRGPSVNIVPKTLTGCEHADAWTRGPRPPRGGLPFAEAA